MVEELSESEDTDEEIVEFIDTDDDMDAMSLEEDENISHTTDFVVDVGRWVLVKYCGKKIVKHYIGQVQAKEDDKWVIKFTRRDGLGLKFKWPKENDEDTVQGDDIVRVLPDPETNKRGDFFTFNVKFDGYQNLL